MKMILLSRQTKSPILEDSTLKCPCQHKSKNDIENQIHAQQEEKISKVNEIIKVNEISLENLKNLNT